MPSGALAFHSFESFVARLALPILRSLLFIAAALRPRRTAILVLDKSEAASARSSASSSADQSWLRRLAMRSLRYWLQVLGHIIRLGHRGRSNPSANMRLIASGRDGLGSGWRSIQASRAASWSGCTRTMTGVAFVSGRPRRRFFLILPIDRMELTIL